MGFVLALLCVCAACSEGDSTPAGSGAVSEKASSKPTVETATKQPKSPGTSSASGQSPAAPSHSELVAKGRRIYLSNCTACHNLDPAKKGSLGPPVAGSSEALIEARVVHGNYPSGYTPKADTRLMVALPYLASDVPALAAYLE